MPDPAFKTDDLDAVLSFLVGKERVTTIKDSGCMTCDVDDVNFEAMPDNDKREYRISGMCSSCQVMVFG